MCPPWNRLELLASWVVPLVLSGNLMAADVDVQSDQRLDQRLERLIEQLGDDRYTTRERAQAELNKLGLVAFEALADAQNDDDIEIALRARYLVRSMHISWTQDHDPPVVKTILKGYEQLGLNERIKRMAALSRLSGGQGTEALCRLARFERTEMLSKQAALQVMDQSSRLLESDRLRRPKVIRTALGRSKRTATHWLRVYVEWLEEPAGALEHWDRMVKAERDLLGEYPDQSSRTIVQELLRRQIEILRRLNRHEQAADASRNLLHLIDGSRDELWETTNWLAEQKSWDFILEAAKRFTEQFEADALLLYRLAQAHLELGDSAEADGLVERALKLNADRPEDHVRTAYILQSRGMHRWAEREYRYVIELGPPGSMVSLESHFLLSEMLHDTTHDQKAADVLQNVVQIMENDTAARRRSRRELASVKSRMHYFFSCSFRAKSDHSNEKLHLEKAIASDPADADVLIAMYHFTEADDQWRSETSTLINKAVDEFRLLIQQSPKESNLYNQLAWLISNTEGDYDEALRYSHKSLELDPDRAGYLDTLGRCYYANGNLEKAIEFQTEAVRLEPFSGQIRLQLDFFESELAGAEVKSPKGAP